MDNTNDLRPTTPEPELRILTAIRQIIRAVDIHSRKLSSRHDITGPQLVCMLEIVDDGPLTVGALARRVHLSASTLVGIVDRLVGKGLIERRRDERDRRRVLLSATDRGRALAVRAPSPLQDTLSAGLDRLPLGERIRLAMALEQIVDLMEARHLEAAPMLLTGPLDPSPGAV